MNRDRSFEKSGGERGSSVRVKFIGNSYDVNLGTQFKEKHIASSEQDAREKSEARSDETEEGRGATNTVIHGSEDTVIQLIREQDREGIIPGRQGSFTLTIEGVRCWVYGMRVGGSGSFRAERAEEETRTVTVKGYIKNGNRYDKALLVTGVTVE